MTAKFSLIDEMSDKLEEMAQKGMDIVNAFRDSEDAANTAFSGMEDTISNACEDMENMGNAVSEYADAMGSASGTADELADSAEEAAQSSEALANAAEKSSEEIEKMGDAAQDSGEKTKDSGDKAVNAIELIASTLIAKKIAEKVMEIAEAVYEMATAFSDAEKIIVNATGATGNALNDLENSMLNAFAANDDAMSDVAGAVGEINTRMGLTGDKLTDVTGLFLDFADVTGSNVVGSVQSVTKVMNQWGIEGDDVGKVMDKLVYATQISGASVDSLTSTLITGAATFQNAGLSIDNTIQMLADFEIAGINGSTAVRALRTAVTGFTKDGRDANTALQETIEAIANMEDQSEATALAIEVFGSMAGQQLAHAIQNGTISVDTFSTSLDQATGALSRSAEAGESLSEKWQKATNSLQSAFTKALAPAIDSISSAFAGVVQSIGDFLNEHPILTKAIAALAIGFGAAAIGVVGFAFATKVAIPQIVAFGTTLGIAFAPLTVIALAIAGVTAAILLLSDVGKKLQGETAGMTATTRAQYYELQNLNEEYERAVEEHGELSDEALHLKYEVDSLSASFEENKQTVEEFTAEVDALCDRVNETADAFHEGISGIKDNEAGTLALIQRYEELATQANLTGAEQKELDAITKQLAKDFPEVADFIGNASGSTDDYVAAMKRACKAAAELAEEEQAREAYTKAYQEKDRLDAEIKKTEELIKLEEERIKPMADADFMGFGRFTGIYDDLDAYKEALVELKAAQAENDAVMSEIEQGWADVAAANTLAEDAVLDYEQAANWAFQSVEGEIMELCQAYDDAYNAAYESFQGQFGLFDEAAANAEASVGNAQAALDSQLAYWDTYASNIDVLKGKSADDLGITQENYDALMAYVQSGTEEAAGLAQSMVDEINAGNDEAVAALANTLAEVQAKQQEAASEIADWQTDFTNAMEEIQNTMEQTVEEMNLSGEAEASAKATIDAYIQQIINSESRAVTAATQLANNVAAALAANPVKVQVQVEQVATTVGAAKGTLNAPSVFIAGEIGPELVARKAAAYAGGTTDSNDFFIAGEQGPELIVGEQGSTVFPTSETEKIISALNNRRPLYINPTISNNTESITEIKQGSENTKRIVLEIEGKGEIDAGSGNKEMVLGLLQDHLKPVLMQIIESEIYEEGELSYDY